MRTLTADELSRINEINGTCEDRYEYMDKIAEIMQAHVGAAVWMVNAVKAVILENKTALDIRTKTVKGVKVINYISIISEDNIKGYFRDKKTGIIR